MPITYSGARNPKWGNPSQTFILIEVNWDHLSEEEWSFCGLVESGDEVYIHELWQRTIAGDFGEIAPYQAPSTIPATETDDDGNVIKEPAINLFIRDRRNELLAESDLAIVPDKWEQMTTEKRAEWTAYRQALRDMPSESKYSNMTADINPSTEEWETSVTITWPTKPS